MGFMPVVSFSIRSVGIVRSGDCKQLVTLITGQRHTEAPKDNEKAPAPFGRTVNGGVGTSLTKTTWTPKNGPLFYHFCMGRGMNSRAPFPQPFRVADSASAGDQPFWIVLHMVVENTYVLGLLVVVPR